MLGHAGVQRQPVLSWIEREEQTRNRSKPRARGARSSRSGAVPWPEQPQNHAEEGLCKQFRVGNLEWSQQRKGGGREFSGRVRHDTCITLRLF